MFHTLDISQVFAPLCREHFIKRKHTCKLGLTPLLMSHDVPCPTCQVELQPPSSCGWVFGLSNSVPILCFCLLFPMSSIGESPTLMIFPTKTELLGSSPFIHALITHFPSFSPLKRCCLVVFPAHPYVFFDHKTSQISHMSHEKWWCFLE